MTQDDVISKPFRIPELMPKIEELVEKYKSLSVNTPRSTSATTVT